MQWHTKSNSHSKKHLRSHICIAHASMTYLVVHFPLSSVVRMSLTDELLHFGSSKRVFPHHGAGVTGGVGLLHGVVIYDLIGAISTSSRRGARVSSCAKVEKKNNNLTPFLFHFLSYIVVFWLYYFILFHQETLMNSFQKHSKMKIL